MSTEKAHQRLQAKLIKHLMSATSSAHMSDMLEALLTPGELQNIATRLEIAHLLKSGMTQRDIAKQLGVGIATVTRGSRELKAGKFKV
ncbi:Trp family transcriptional regulator [Marinagarivorans cellulosilyticus]|uniref:TrpR family transcriptional regulator, trp operon repressor n=1 Tax=Marinagarivorans cellulosilyticus TaxID=2721545 RepID=A0AAN1WK95_9GAMM|nr:Trp family transcriptional regulator [Marinagarivorans cellulosilyticus]BCD99129.1 TrpR family transcriptional regulator, trp operon repressor [Marinagarivorans cellulosilyticus]